LKPVVLPELRYRRLWVAVGVFLMIAIAYVCLMPGPALPSVAMSDKLQHLLGFGALAFWFGSIVVRRELLWVGVGVVAFGGLIELAQGAMGMGRQGDWRDLAADALGVVIGLALALTPLGRCVRWFEAQVTRALA
jgi:VanZ family protein